MRRHRFQRSFSRQGATCSTTPPIRSSYRADRTILLEVDNPFHSEARDAIAPFAEVAKSPEPIHTYRLRPLSLWYAAAAGMPGSARFDALEPLSQKFPLPSNVPADLREETGGPLWQSAPLSEKTANSGWLRRIARCSKSWHASAACATTWANVSTRPASASKTVTGVF